MYIYVWKDTQGTPFYVGLTKRIGRTNPKNNGGRNWLTRQKLQELGADNVIVEIRHVESTEEGQRIERELIAKIGRIQLGTGPLTNLREGGEGTHSPSPEHRAKLREAMMDPNHPCRSEAARAKHRERMLDPAVRAMFTGDNNPAKKETVREKLKAIWQNPEYQERQRNSRTGVPKHFSAEDLARRAEAVKNNPAMKGWAELNGKDPEFEAKRIAGLKASQPKRLAKMADPAALAQRKARLKATMNSEEFKAKRAEWDTPEYRAKLSEARKAYWAKKRAST